MFRFELAVAGTVVRLAIEPSNWKSFERLELVLLGRAST